VADEIRVQSSLVYDDSESRPVSIQIPEFLKSIATKKFIHHKVSVGFAAEEAIPLGECTSPGWAMFVNRDATNFINLKVATGGAIFAKLLPGEMALFRLGSGAQAPYAIADTAACQLEYLILQT